MAGQAQQPRHEFNSTKRDCDDEDVHLHRTRFSLPSIPLQSPNSYFMDVRCPGCFAITTVFSHATTVVVCGSCALMLCQPTGGKARLTEGCSFRRKQE